MEQHGHGRLGSLHGGSGSGEHHGHAHLGHAHHHSSSSHHSNSLHSSSGGSGGQSGGSGHSAAAAVAAAAAANHANALAAAAAAAAAANAANLHQPPLMSHLPTVRKNIHLTQLVTHYKEMQSASYADANSGALFEAFFPLKVISSPLLSNVFFQFSFKDCNGPEEMFVNIFDKFLAHCSFLNPAHCLPHLAKNSSNHNFFWFAVILRPNSNCSFFSSQFWNRGLVG